MSRFEKPGDENTEEQNLEKEPPQPETVERILELAREMVIKDTLKGSPDYGNNYVLNVDGTEYMIMVNYDARKEENETLEDTTIVAEISLYYDATTAFYAERFAFRKNQEVLKELEINTSLKDAESGAYTPPEKAAIFATPDQDALVPTNEADMQRLVRLLEDLKGRKSLGAPREDDPE